MSKLKAAEVCYEFINIARQLYEDKKISTLDIEILCIVYVKREQGYNVYPSDIYNLTNYRYGGEIYKRTKALKKAGYLEEFFIKQVKRNRRHFKITVKGINLIMPILEYNVFI